MKDGSGFSIRLLAVLSVIIFTVAMSAVMYFSANKTIKIQGDGQGTGQAPTGDRPLSIGDRPLLSIGDRPLSVGDRPSPKPQSLRDQKGQRTVVLELRSSTGSDMLVEGIPLAEISLDIFKIAGESLSENGVDVIMTSNARGDIENINASPHALYTGFYMTSGTGVGLKAYYNENYVIPGFGNVDLSDGLLRGVGSRIKGKCEGVFPTGADDVLNSLAIPGTLLEISLSEDSALTTTLATPEGRQVFGKALAESILEMV